MNLTKSIGLKPTLVYKDEKEIVPFRSIVVPPSMRSPLWKYFGFPADENKEIITKTKIICCICYSHVAYNKNTTNLSTHLSNKHPELLGEIKTKREHGNMEEITSPSKRSKLKEDMTINWNADDDTENSATDHQIHPTGITEKTYVKKEKTLYKPKFQFPEQIVILSKPKSEDEHNKNTSNEPESESESQYIETIDYDDIHINEDGNEIIAEVLAVTDAITDENTSKNEFLSPEYLSNAENNEVLYEDLPKKMVIPSKLPLKANKASGKCKLDDHNPSEVLHKIKNFLIKDLASPSIIDGSGFKEMMKFLAPNSDIPTSLLVEASMDKEYNLQRSQALSDIKAIVNSRNYSLSCHKLGNSSFVEVSVNYWLDGDDRISSLETQIFCISKNCTNFIVSFGDGLKNCSAFVVDFDLESDFGGNVPLDIPIIPTFSFVTKVAFEACMQLSAIETAVESADQILGNKIANTYTWLQKFECLSQFLNETEHTEHNQIIQVFVECLQPLKNCLDVLAFETSAYASIMKPVALQLINQHYSENAATESVETDIAVLEKDLKRTILEVFQRYIINNSFLTMSSFLDPRFQRLTASSDLSSIRGELEKNVETNDMKSENRTEVKQLKLKQDKHFGLSSLFSNISTAPKTKAPKNRFDIEFRSYTEDVSLDMELCPLEWWLESETLYPNIKQHVKKYFCVPSFVNNLHRLPLQDQEELEQKYDRLDNDIGEKFLWLHLNELRQRLLES